MNIPGIRNEYRVLLWLRKAECERLEKELANLADNILADERDTYTAGTLESELFDELQ